MKTFRIVLVAVFALGMTACAGVEANATLAEARAAAAAIKAQAAAVQQPVTVAPAIPATATTPAVPAVVVTPPAAVIDAAQKLSANAEKVDAQLAKAQEVANGVQAIVAALDKNTQANASLLDKVTALSVAVAQGAHAAAPGTTADGYAGLAAVAFLGLSKLVSTVKSNSTLRTAITTPGTTEAQPTASPGKQ